jgi:hypothetical protein
MGHRADGHGIGRLERLTKPGGEGSPPHPNPLPRWERGALLAPLGGQISGMRSSEEER